MSDFPLTWMADAFRQNGLSVRESKGWRRAGSGSFAPRGVLFHHTASNRRSGAKPALGIVVKGRAGVKPLPPPLCNVLIGRDGVVYLIAAGRAHHAGFGGPWGNIPKNSGNKYTVGVEVENDGVGEPWREELLQVCDVVFATLLIGLHRSAKFLAGHKEWAPRRKIDPAGIVMKKYRDRVDQEIRAIKQAQEPKGPRPARRKPAPAGVYVVKAGDTLFAIARSHGMSLSALRKLNPQVKGDLIHPGDRLKVRGKGR